jgi:hypothetical protein
VNEAGKSDAGSAANRGAYLVLLALQVAGAIVILWHGVPIYRSLLPGKTYQPLDPTATAWAIAGVLLLQIPYWVSTLKVFPSLPASRQTHPRQVFAGRFFLGHVVLFLARLSFVFASSLFVVIVLGRAADIVFVWWRALILASVLFAMFCFTLELELERLGRRLSGE